MAAGTDVPLVCGQVYCRHDCRRSLGGVRRGQKPEGRRVVGVSFVNPPVRSKRRHPRQPQPTGRRPEESLPRYPGRRKEQMRSASTNHEPQVRADAWAGRGVWEPHWDGDWTEKGRGTRVRSILIVEEPLGALRLLYRVEVVLLLGRATRQGWVGVDRYGGTLQGVGVALSGS